jgi:hypothetical protein
LQRIEPVLPENTYSNINSLGHNSATPSNSGIFLFNRGIFFDEQGNLSAEQRNRTRPSVWSAQHIISDRLGHAVEDQARPHRGDKPDPKGYVAQS